ncbi:uncharacterized protein EKO05_0001802 [Ascochyta rabiei]|uniref:uncharacterized protein n=1 Tax=Didymella rabiei TaxID=5454 RepID=UPI0021FB0171|nr:uncharacterized protein EKO05_0001802 [Ascochyta rabiei]UPX11180.1 hypothetical protein EKO05_0001802 [Ascochyta rabiei]
MAGESLSLDVTQLPAHSEVKATLTNPLFFPSGGFLAKYCSHAYAYATNEGIRALPAVLKGSDMVTYEVFQSLGIRVQLRPALDYGHWAEDFDDFMEYDRIGKRLTEPIGSNEGGYEDCDAETIFEYFPQDKLHVKWLNKPVTDNANMQYTFLAYGNQAELNWSYSYCVLLMRIPSYSERVQSTN